MQQAPLLDRDTTRSPFDPYPIRRDQQIHADLVKSLQVIDVVFDFPFLKKLSCRLSPEQSGGRFSDFRPSITPYFLPSCPWMTDSGRQGSAEAFSPHARHNCRACNAHSVGIPNAFASSSGFRPELAQKGQSFCHQPLSFFSAVQAREGCAAGSYQHHGQAVCKSVQINTQRAGAREPRAGCGKRGRSGREGPREVHPGC